MEDEQLIISAVIAGNTAQYRQLVERYQQPVFKVIYKIVGNIEDAKELTQDVFVKAYESLSHYKKEYKFFSWIYRIAINSALLYVRSKKKFVPIDEVSNELSHIPDYNPEDDFCNRIVETAINELNEQYKSVILLKYYAELSYADMALTLGIPEKTVKSRLFDARKKLKDKLVKHHILL